MARPTRKRSTTSSRASSVCDVSAFVAARGDRVCAVVVHLASAARRPRGAGAASRRRSRMKMFAVAGCERASSAGATAMKRKSRGGKSARRAGKKIAFEKPRSARPSTSPKIFCLPKFATQSPRAAFGAIAISRREPDRPQKVFDANCESICRTSVSCNLDICRRRFRRHYLHRARRRVRTRWSRRTRGAATASSTLP